MKRRTAIKNVGLGIGTLLSLPTWAKTWTAKNLPNVTIFEEKTKVIIASLCQAIIPKTESPGAKEIGIPAFVEAVIADCYPKDKIEGITKGLKALGGLSEAQYNQSIDKLNSEQINSLLNGVTSMPDLPEFIALNELKNLSIQAYTNSEYYLINVAKWEFAPAPYLGCVPLNP